MSLTDKQSQALTQARALAKHQVAEQCQVDLYFLCKHILGYDLMTPQVHEPLANYTRNLLPGQAKKAEPASPEVQLAPIATSEKDGRQKSSLIKDNKGAPEKFLGEKIQAGNPIESPSVDFKPETNSGTYILPHDSQIGGVANSGDINKLEVQEYDPSKNFLLLLMPRGTFKSSVVTIGFTLQFLLNDPDARILIDSETFGKGKAFLSEIKGHLENNDKFREIYKTLYNVYPDAKKRESRWTDNQVDLAARKKFTKEPNISVAGVDIPKTGMHYDLIIGDDWHSERNVTTKEQIEQVIEHYKLALSLLDPGKPLIVIGTRWDYNDVYQYILDYEQHRFNILIRRAVNPDGSLLFPERLTQGFLDETKQSQGSYIFSCQYMNDPVDNETATFKRSYLQNKKSLEDIKNLPMNWFMSVDPSYEGEYSDYNAITIVGMDFQRNLYVRDIVRKKMNYAELITTIFMLYEKAAAGGYPIKRIVLETVATQKSLQYELSNEQRRRGTWLPVQEIRSRTKSKEERIRGLAPFYEFGHIFHIRSAHNLDELEYELLHFPKGKHDDIIDSLATILEIASAPSGRYQDETKREKRKHQVDILTKPRSPVTRI